MSPITEPPSRPQLAPGLPASEFGGWYWTKSELVDFARILNICFAGDKASLTARIAATLAGQPASEMVTAGRTKSPQLSGALTADTLIPAGQRCSQVIRAWFLEQTGGLFHFDAAMRNFFSSTDGTTTLQDALDHWHATRSAPRAEIGVQFEYNRFTRQWWAANPNGTRAQLLAAWFDYRERPVDARGMV